MNEERLNVRRMNVLDKTEAHTFDPDRDLTREDWNNIQKSVEYARMAGDFEGLAEKCAWISIIDPKKGGRLTDDDWKQMQELEPPPTLTRVVITPEERENTKKFLASSILRVMDFPVRAKAWRAARILWPGRRQEFGISPQDRVRMVKELHRKKAFNLDSLQLAADIKVILADDIRITKEHGLEALRRKDSYAEGVAAAPPILEV